VLSLSVAAQNPQSQQKRTWRISTDVSADDGVKSVITSNINSGLRSLQELCKRVVADIDVGPIEAERKYWQGIEDNVKRFGELKKQYPNKSDYELWDMVDREKKKP
jgi:hypothetical protein